MKKLKDFAFSGVSALCRQTFSQVGNFGEPSRGVEQQHPFVGLLELHDAASASGPEPFSTFESRPDYSDSVG